MATIEEIEINRAVDQIFGCFYSDHLRPDSTREGGTDFKTIKKYRDCLRILQQTDYPTDNELKFLAYTLLRIKTPKLTIEQILDVFDKNMWLLMPSGKPYNRTTSKGILERINNDNTKGSTANSFSRHASAHPQITVDELLSKYVSCVIPRLQLPARDQGITDAYYHLQCALFYARVVDYHILPKMPAWEEEVYKNGKKSIFIDGKYPGQPRPGKRGSMNKDDWKEMDWKPYQTRKPTISEMQSWDWTHGLCWIFKEGEFLIDVDTKDGKPGMDHIKPFASTMLNGNHWEYSQSHSPHIFCKGKVPTNKKFKSEGIEILGKGTLAVIYPTPKYTLP